MNVTYWQSAGQEDEASGVTRGRFSFQANVVHVVAPKFEMCIDEHYDSSIKEGQDKCYCGCFDQLPIGKPPPVFNSSDFLEPVKVQYFTEL